jgi:hypothetical protein
LEIKIKKKNLNEGRIEGVVRKDGDKLGDGIEEDDEGD